MVFRARNLNREASVLVGGQRCPVLGANHDGPDDGGRTRLCLTLSLGDEVVLIGRQGDEEILGSGGGGARREQFAWEIFTGIGSRVRRVYL